jgi:hypothetical protein
VETRALGPAALAAACQPAGEFLNATGSGNDPATLETLYLYGSGDLTISKAEAQKRLDKILQNPKHPYWNKKGDKPGLHDSAGVYQQRRSN